MRSLNARLMAGMLAVTAIGMVLMALISTAALRGYLMHRVNGQLQAVQKKPALARTGDSVAPARYIILNMAPDGTVRAVSGDDPDPAAALEQARRMGPGPFFDRAAGGRPFAMGSMRAVARLGPRGRVVIVVAPLGEIRASLAWLIVSELLTSAFILGVLALLGRWLIRRGLAPVSRMATTAQGIASGGDLRARMEVSDSEVGRLAGAINVMLDRIEQAFVARVRSEAKVREFAADASHELRTPLTTIRGYSELYEQGAVDADEAMRRISSESERMRRLVEELLELARLDKGSALTMERVDLAALARDAVADAAAVEPDRPLTLDAPEHLSAMADEGRIRQVLANLLANVRAHTPAGTPALVRLTQTATTMIIEVADEGPGMAPDEAARAFDRFHHTSGGEGTGLGLAIVAAIAAAHGGRARLRSSPGTGTGVRIELPRGGQVLEGVVQPEHTKEYERGQR
ncbi:HAMP domain-containing sensor histidine kinase [Actinomadura sp. DC4]|uniref:sensor histidine kinase n=1 Tax=Actinomadura sp. DC4 TaxID=3055069 RepID=UPI0025B0F2A0|nr:HAMP domain-containing sensor histidine kinase [Actinomadura sp. DC4]MDN3356703.1 HAMP domain-containing sensor histidine kinase [Actinomadura sp. DC4]